MRAVVDRVDLRRGCFQTSPKMLLIFQDTFLSEVTTCDPGLVCHYDRQPAAVVEQLDRLGCIWEQAKTRRMVHVADFLGNGSVAVHEECGSFHLLFTRPNRKGSSRFSQSCPV